MSERCEKAPRAKQTTTNREKERVNDRSHPCRSPRDAHERETGAGIGNNSKKFKRVPSQTLRVWIFLCFFNQRIFSILAVILLLLAGGTTEEVILVLGDVSRQVVGRVHERELFRQVSRVGHFLLLKNSLLGGKGKRKMAHVCLGFWYKIKIKRLSL